MLRVVGCAPLRPHPVKALFLSTQACRPADEGFHRYINNCQCSQPKSASQYSMQNLDGTPSPSGVSKTATHVLNPHNQQLCEQKPKYSIPTEVPRLYTRHSTISHKNVTAHLPRVRDGPSPTLRTARQTTPSRSNSTSTSLNHSAKTLPVRLPDLQFQNNAPPTSSALTKSAKSLWHASKDGHKLDNPSILNNS